MEQIQHNYQNKTVLSSSPTDCAFHSREISVAIAEHTRLNGLQAIVAAELVQQIHYWMSKGQGKIVDGVRWIYNSYRNWLATQFPTLSTYCFRKIKNALVEINLIECEKLDKHRYNQTYYYSLNYSQLQKLLGWKDSPKPLKSPNVRSTNHQSSEVKTIDGATVEQSYTNTTSNKTTKKNTLSLLVEKLPEEEREKFLAFSRGEVAKLPNPPVFPDELIARKFDTLYARYKESVVGVAQNNNTQAQFAEWYDLMHQLGHVVGQKIENGVQMVQDIGGRWSTYEQESQWWKLDYLRKCVKGR